MVYLRKVFFGRRVVFRRVVPVLFLLIKGRLFLRRPFLMFIHFTQCLLPERMAAALPCPRCLDVSSFSIYAGCVQVRPDGLRPFNAICILHLQIYENDALRRFVSLLLVKKSWFVAFFCYICVILCIL